MGNFDAALALARLGLAVFPCEEAGKVRKRPKPGVRWRQASRADPDDVHALWKRFPNAVPGVDLAKAGLLVIDCDRKPNGPDGVTAFTSLCDAEAYDLSDAPQVTTPSGGLHVYFRQLPGEKPLGNATGDLPPGIDVRGAGGYVIGPGSRFTDDGTGYELAGDVALTEAPFVPGWLVKRLKAPKVGRDARQHDPFHAPRQVVTSSSGSATYVEMALANEAARVASAGERTRNQSLNIAALKLGHYVGAGLLHAEDVRRALLAAAESCGLIKDDGVKACEATIRSGLTKGMAEPRGVPERDRGDEEAQRLGAAIAAGLASRLQRPSLVETEAGELIDPSTGEVLGAPAGWATPAGQADLGSEDGVHSRDDLSHIPLPPGLVGGVAQWICETSRRPNPSLALAASLTLIGTLAGRHLATPTRSGTHLYVLGLGVTGSGKDHPMAQAKRLLRATNCLHHLGPGEFISMPAVVNFLCRAPLALCVMDEFGAFLKRINARRASGFEGAISKVLRTIWGASFQDYTTPEWAGREFATIMGPAISLLGASTHEEFYASLEGGSAEDGTLNRFLLFDCGRARPRDRDPVLQADHVPAELKAGLRAIYERSGVLITAQLNQIGLEPRPTCLSWGEGAQALFQTFQRDVERRGDADARVAAFMARSAEMAVRIATIVAVGRGAEAVETDDMQYGIDLTTRSAKAMMGGARDYMAGSEHQDNVNRLRRAIRHAGGVLRHRDLQRGAAQRMRARDLNDAIKTLEEGEEITVESVQSPRGRPSFVYRLV